MSLTPEPPGSLRVHFSILEGSTGRAARPRARSHPGRWPRRPAALDAGRVGQRHRIQAGAGGGRDLPPAARSDDARWSRQRRLRDAGPGRLRQDGGRRALPLTTDEKRQGRTGRSPRPAGAESPPTSGDSARRGAQGGGWGAGTIDPSCDPTPCPSPPVHPPGRLHPGGRNGKNRARFARFFFAALCAAKGRRGTRPYDSRKGAKR